MQERALHLLGGADEALARAGEFSPGGAPVEQLGADRFFERRYATADRRMVELEPLGGGDELPTARDGEEDADVIPIHERRLAHFRTADARSLELLCAKSWRIKPTSEDVRERSDDRIWAFHRRQDGPRQVGSDRGCLPADGRHGARQGGARLQG